MHIEIIERRLIDLSDGRTLSLHPGIIDCEDKLAKELIAGGMARRPPPPKPMAIMKDAPPPPTDESAAENAKEVK